MFDLKVFQVECANTITDRYNFFLTHPDRPYKGKNTPRPFFQALSAITGAGKTPVLAQTISTMRNSLEQEPIVFWISKSRSVVGQTYNNFSKGGKYSHLIEEFKVINVQELRPEFISDNDTPLIILATTALFNNKDQSEGGLNIYKKDADLFGNKSPWERLVERATDKAKRPLYVVYDEGHNLSEQQTAILAELMPDAYLLASATIKLPESFSKSVVLPLKTWVEECSDVDAFKKLNSLSESGQPDPNKFITTSVSSDKVVEAELVKRSIQFDGTTAPMEKCIDELISRMSIIKKEIKSRNLSISPKAIYVCKTNISDDGEKDDGSRPFNQRKAPPIRIWRYLVEDKKIDPKDIAIYANLTFVDKSQPKELNLFSKGESDFDDFSKGNYKHIIFNLSLQEGWDDPSCYLAYIDKSMGSSTQVEQVIGRVLRQPLAKHYDTPLLNCAHFFLRVDNQSVFTEAVSKVRNKLQAEGAAIEIFDNFSKKSISTIMADPKDDTAYSLHHVHVESDSACKEIENILGNFPTFVEGSADTFGSAHTGTQVVDMTKLSDEKPSVEWKAGGNSNSIRLRWLINNAIKARSNRALAVTNLQNPKFDVRVQMKSVANSHAEKLAKEIVEAYYAHSDLVYEDLNPFIFGPIRDNPSSVFFKNGLYEKYSGFNKLEKSFADAVDNSGNLWHRNQTSGGFFIPLLSEGDTSSFYPDFIVWKDNMIYCLDTKGGHLLSDAVARKLFDIKDGTNTKILVRFITEGKQKELRGNVTKDGYTVWKMKRGAPAAVFVDTLDKAVEECLKA